MTVGGSTFHERIFRLLLRLYPGWFLDVHGEEMVQLFRARLERSGGTRDTLRTWWQAGSDIVSTAIALRRRRRTAHEGRGGGMGTLAQDIRHAIRHLARSPTFTAGAVMLLAVGIGANTAVFSLVDALLFRPPVWDRPEEVVHVYQDSDDGEPSSSSYPATRDMAASPVFAAVAAMSPSSAAWEGPDGPVRLSVEYTTASYLDVLGLGVLRGRWFGPEHDLIGSEPVAVVSEATWRSLFGEDTGVVGRTVRLNGQPVTIIGVGPKGLTGTFSPMATDLWLSISATLVGGDFQVANLERREDHWYDVRARLAPGVGIEQAQAAMDALALRLAEEYPELNRGRDITVFGSKDVRLHPSADGGMALAGGLLSAVVLTVLILACANLANLLLVRGVGRSGEMAVRRAVGASRSRVGRLFLVESLLLSALGGATGLVLAWWVLRLAPTLPVDLPLGARLTLGLDARVVAFTLALVAATGALFGLAPAVRSARTDVALVLREDGRTASPGRGASRLRNVLVAVQVAASLVLVVGTGLLARSLAAVQGVDPGVETDRVAWVRVGLNSAGLSLEEARVAMDEILERVRALPGVSAAAWTSRLPASPGGTTTTEVEGYTPPAGTDAVELPFHSVTYEYFETMGIPLVAGRLFGPEDLTGVDVPILINETAARRFYGGAEALGRRMRGQGGDRWSRVVVGVVGDVPVSSLAESPRPSFYFSARMVRFAPEILVVRTDGEPSSVLPALRREIPVVRSSFDVSAQGTLASHFGEGLAGPRLATAALGGFSLLAVILAGLGIYAVVSFGVARRSAELGIRIALGAERARVVRLVVGDVVGTVLLGLAAGVALTALAAPRVGGLLFGVGGFDPLTIVGSIAFLLGVAWLAAYAPARRAARSDPVEALRVS